MIAASIHKLCILGFCTLFCATLVVSGCDSVEPTEDNLLVVQGFLNAGAPLPEVTITKAFPLDQHTGANPLGVRDASLVLYINEEPVPYGLSDEQPGIYTPLTNQFDVVPPNAHFRAEIEWLSNKVSTEDFIPPPIAIDSVRIEIPPQPVAAVFTGYLATGKTLK